jgi:1,2-diacylglycerol 3-alpha-glucosyltransferase
MKRFNKRDLKIAMVIDAWFPHYGGGQIHVWELAKSLQEKGCQVDIITRNLGGWTNPRSDIKVIRLGRFKKFSNIYGRIEFLFLSLLHLLNSDYDIIHAHAFSPGLLGPLLKAFSEKLVVFTVHGKGFKVAGSPINMNFLEELIFYKVPYDLEITVAGNTLKRPTKAKITKIIPNGVNIDNFRKAIRKRSRIKRIIYVGRLSYEKGVDLLIEAFRLIPQKDISLTIIGDGEEFNNLKQISKKLAIEFLGRLEGKALIDQFKRADLLVLPSRTEGQPIILLEAWAAKLPVLATRVGDNEKFIKNGKNGFLAEPTVNSLKESLEEALNSDKLIQISENGFKDVKNYTWGEITDRTYQSYQEAMND